MELPPLLAVDPGTDASGYVLFDRAEQRVVESGVLPNDKMLEKCLLNYPLAIEMIASYGMSVGQEVFETCVWIGRFMQAHEPYATDRVYRRDVKLHLCGTPRAKDTNIWQALVDRFGPVGTKKAPGVLYGVKSHARAALALAVTWADQHDGR
jgi:hypothetical protein